MNHSNQRGNMHRLLGWMMLVFLCCAAAGEVGEQKQDARLVEAQVDFDAAKMLKHEGKYSEALVRAEHSLELREKTLGGTHADVAHCLNLLGNLHRLNGELPRAESLLRRALAIRESVLGPAHPDVATSLDSLASLHYKQGRYEQAEPLLQRALTLRETALGPTHPHVAVSLNNLAALFYAQGLYDRAEPLYRRALNLHETTQGPDHPDVASSLNNLALLYSKQDFYALAESSSKRALAIREKALGPTHPDVADSLNNLALLYSRWGLYEQAETLLQRALALYETVLGSNHLGVAAALDNLAVLYSNQGWHGRAESLLQRALAIREMTLGPTHPDVAISLNSLAALYYHQESYGQAEPLFQRALALRKAALGPTHPDVAESLNNLALLYSNQGLYGRAEPLMRRALAIHEAAQGSTNLDFASSLGNLAVLYYEQGLYGRAEPLMKRALALHEAIQGPTHPDVANLLNNLACLRSIRHRLASALPLFTRSLSISEKRLHREALTFSESHLSNFLLHMRSNEEVLYSLLHAHTQSAPVRRLALSAVLLRKGRSIDETAHISRAVYRSLSFEDHDTFERLRGLRSQLAALSTTSPSSLSPKEHQARIQKLTDEGDSLEAILAKNSAPLRSFSLLPGPEEIVDRVATSLPKDGALVEFISYVYKSPPTQHVLIPAAVHNESRYLALVLFPGGATQAVDLGPTKKIDSAAARLREVLADHHDDESHLRPAQELYKLIFEPLRPLLGATRRLLLSPDGRLGLVPFAALHDGHEFLLDSFDFTYLTSGRDLLSYTQESDSSSVVVIANPDFLTPTASSSNLTPPFIPRSTSLEHFFSRPFPELQRSAWKELPGTQQEAEDIQGLLPQAQLFLGAEATKERLFSLPTPGILHVATHGFFLDEDASASPQGSRAPFQFNTPGSRALEFITQDPLLRSGLVLAGARAQTPNASASPPDASLVTALELAGLNLWGTQLVVLSACDTGRGQDRPGLGIYGLRRALVIAGAKTVVMSLWTVGDDSTREFMKIYYQNLLAGQGRASALHTAMRSFRTKHPDPHDWAPFIALGSDAPLRGIVPTAP